MKKMMIALAAVVAFAAPSKAQVVEVGTGFLGTGLSTTTVVLGGVVGGGVIAGTVVAVTNGNKKNEQAPQNVTTGTS